MSEQTPVSVSRKGQVGGGPACFQGHDQIGTGLLQSPLMKEPKRDLQRRKVPVQGGGSCIYCGSDGGADGLRDEHIVPYSLGGNAVLLAASCSACEKITSYLDGYLAKAIYGDLRVHSGVQSRRGHPELLPALVSIEGSERTLNLEPGSHPYFLNMPVWNAPGFMRGASPDDGFGNATTHMYWYVPPDIRETLKRPRCRACRDPQHCTRT